jgi:hypothetical protein
VLAIESRPRRVKAQHDRAERNWLFVLIVGLIVALPVLLYWGRDQWFFLDEWAVLVNRQLGDVGDLLEAHNGHWVTPLALEYLVNQRVFGVDSYLPYQLWAVLSHLVVVLMVWFVMRRLAVRPAVCTATALPFAFYGAGATNIVFGFQFSLTLSVVCGLAQLLLADHDGPLNRRDAFAVVIGVVGIMSSAVGPPMVVGVAVAVLLRRGWRAAAVQAAPLAAIYLAWYAVFNRDLEGQELTLTPKIVPFVAEMARAAFSGMGRHPLVSLGLAALAVLGGFEIWRRWRTQRSLAPVAVPAALVSAFVAFAALTGLARADGFGVESAAEQRYIYIAAALFLPFVALGGEVLARRRLVLGVAPLVLLLIGIPANIDDIRDRELFALGARRPVAVVAWTPLLDQLDPGERVFSAAFAPELAPSAEWLRERRDSGGLSEVGDATAEELVSAEAVIALAQRGPAAEADDGACPVGPPRQETLVRGDRIRFTGTVRVSIVDEGEGSRSRPFRYDAANGSVVLVRAGPVQVLVEGLPGSGGPAICEVVPATP